MLIVHTSPLRESCGVWPVGPSGPVGCGMKPSQLRLLLANSADARSHSGVSSQSRGVFFPAVVGRVVPLGRMLLSGNAVAMEGCAKSLTMVGGMSQSESTQHFPAEHYIVTR